MATIQNSKNMPINPMEICRIPKEETNRRVEKAEVLKILEEHKQELIDQMNQIAKQEKTQFPKEQKGEGDYKISMSLDEDENFIHIIVNWINWNELQYAIGIENVYPQYHNELLKKLINQIREIVQKEFPGKEKQSLEKDSMKKETLAKDEEEIGEER